uniref:Uncharacterized protein n=1 Tax=Cannabis sativa TaxID=3483 RepID=A0A803PBE6_CANSA
MSVSVPTEFGRLSIPKHKFLIWQAVNSHLLTGDLLVRFAIPLEVKNWCNIKRTGIIASILNASMASTVAMD